ncbi:ferredoxin [Peptacetobacter sp. AB845]|uniref:ferredoxin n=1 Tax=Peptacetobacter sp. AB845 TaxID=3388429 RepID=UPI0039C96C38
MKKFEVSTKCNACGLCFTASDFFEEDERGMALAKSEKYIEDIAKAEEIVGICPTNAISIVSSGRAKNDGKEGLNELLSAMTKELNFKEYHPTTKEFKFETKEYTVCHAYPRGEYSYSYSSYSRAERAGLEEFDKIAYSQYSKFLIELFVQYKSDKLRKYYTKDENGFYKKFNLKIEKILNEIATEAKYISNNSINLKDSFTEFNVFPETEYFPFEDVTYKLAHFEEQSDKSGVMTEFRSNSYTKLSDYASYMDVDDRDEYIGSDWRGNPKEKTMYCYCNVMNAIKEFISDLKSSVNYVDIDEKAEYMVNDVLDMYYSNVKKEVSKKINEFRDAISKIK